MVEIEAECPACGTVRVVSTRWRLVVYPEATNRSFCEFVCDCQQVVVVRATPIIIAALQHVIPLTVEHIPLEALEPHDGSALSEDDYIAFMHELTQLP